MGLHVKTDKIRIDYYEGAESGAIREDKPIVCSFFGYPVPTDKLNKIRNQHSHHEWVSPNDRVEKKREEKFDWHAYSIDLFCETVSDWKDVEIEVDGAVRTECTRDNKILFRVNMWQIATWIMSEFEKAAIAGAIVKDSEKKTLNRGSHGKQDIAETA